MLAAHVPVPAAPAPAAKAASRDEDIDRTKVLRTIPPAGGLEQTKPGVAAPPMALKVVEGARKGEVIVLDKANTMIGTAGADTALVVKRAGKFLIARLSGQRPLKLNRRELGPGTHPLTEQDVIDVGNSRFEVILAAT
jgi:hypothetical protein